MTEQQNPAPLTKYRVAIPLGARVVEAVERFFTLIATGLASIVLAFIVPIRILFTVKRDIYMPSSFLPQQSTQSDYPRYPLDEEEAWLREHREEYGDENK